MSSDRITRAGLPDPRVWNRQAPDESTLPIGHPDRLWPHANLSRNPFGELNREERARLAVVDLDEMISSLCDRPPSVSDWRACRGVLNLMPPDLQPRRCYQLIGRCGRGKTTHLLALKEALATASYVYLPEDTPCPTIPDGWPLLIDEAQRLPSRAVRKVFSTGVPLVLATHRNLAWKLRRHGYQVVTRTIGRSLSAESLSELLNRRLLASRRDAERSVAQIGLDDCRELIRRYGTNVRAIEHYLYDIVQSQVHCHGEMQFID